MTVGKTPSVLGTESFLVPEFELRTVPLKTATLLSQRYHRFILIPGSLLVQKNNVGEEQAEEL